MVTAMKIQDHAIQESNGMYHYIRERLNALFLEALKFPLVVVCAGAGYGKTSAILDFAKGYKATITWLSLSERYNEGQRFWESFTHAIAQINRPFAKGIHDLGFPDNDELLNTYFQIARKYETEREHILVFDNFHLIDDPAILHFIERSVSEMLPGKTFFLVSRSTPRINIAGLTARDKLLNITESQLCFSEQELAGYFRQNGIPVNSGSVRSIMQDTGGWAFAINLIARSFRQAPGYDGYVRNAMKMNIFLLMENEIWSKISDPLRNFLLRLSLIDHLAADLIALLAKGDHALIAELDRQNAFVRRDNYISAYKIHNMFLEFLSQKQDLLSEEDKRETYEIAACWCDRNGFKVDALSYYEMIGDYRSITSLFFAQPAQVPQDIAQYAVGIFERAPKEAFNKIDFLAVMHIRAIMGLGLWKEAFALLAHYEAIYQQLPADNAFRSHMLGGIYYCWGILRMLMATIDERYDFDEYYAKMDECLTRYPIDPGRLPDHPAGPWISTVGSSWKGAPQDFIQALTRAVGYASHCLNGTMAGLDELAKGELKYYQGDVTAAEPLILRSLERAREKKQYETVHRALFYQLQISVFQGNREKVEQILAEMNAMLKEEAYPVRDITHDVALAWFHCTLEQPEMVPDWLKEKISAYGHAFFIENFGNQAKAKYCYLTKNYPLLLAYMEEQKQRESVLYGRVEMLAMEACVHYKLQNKEEALAALQQAYEEGEPNSIFMPFICLGKDMRTLTAYAMKSPDCRIPQEWLEEINRRSATYAKRKAHIITAYKQTNRLEEGVAFSQREEEVLTDLSHGLSRREIAVSRSLSVNTVKMIINAVYSKLGAENLADLIRITTELRMI